MKKFLALFTFFGYFAIFALMLITGCEGEPDIYPKTTVEYGFGDIVPDSLQAKHKTYVTELVKAASFHMTGGDYEDPEDVLMAAESIANRMYQKRVDGLDYFFQKSEETYPEKTFIPFEKLDSAQKKLYFQLKPNPEIRNERKN